MNNFNLQLDFPKVGSEKLDHRVMRQVFRFLHS